MAITVVANPVSLTWADFTTSPVKILDPGDGTLQETYTKFISSLPALPARMVNGQFAMADPNVITVTPQAKVYTGVRQTLTLLSHEQFHYDVGIVVSRAYAHHLMTLRAINEAALVTALRNAFNLHFEIRAPRIQAQYDRATRHSKDSLYQKIWKDRMATCLAHPHSHQLGGFWL